MQTSLVYENCLTFINATEMRFVRLVSTSQRHGNGEQTLGTSTIQADGLVARKALVRDKTLESLRFFPNRFQEFVDAL